MYLWFKDKNAEVLNNVEKYENLVILRIKIWVWFKEMQDNHNVNFRALISEVSELQHCVKAIGLLWYLLLPFASFFISQNIVFILNRWGTGEPISLSPGLQPALSWDFYHPSGIRRLTSHLQKTRKQQRHLVLFRRMNLLPHLSPISSFPFLSTWVLSQDCKRCWRC